MTSLTYPDFILFLSLMFHWISKEVVDVDESRRLFENKRKETKFMHFIGLAGWSSRRSRGRGEHQSATSRGQTHRWSMWRPQREGWHPALHQRDRGPHCQTYGATQAVSIPSSGIWITSNVWWMLRVILRHSFVGSNCNLMPLARIYYLPGNYAVVCQPWASVHR